MEEPRDLARALAANVRARALYQPARRPAAPRAPSRVVPDDWESLRAEALSCERCTLCATRTHVVFGEGPPRAELMFVGEAPGRDEDLQGRPFVGRAGKLLTDMIAAMGFAREDVYIANVLKCRPPENRDPAPGEVAACRGYLMRQIALVDPKVVCTLGRHALHCLSDAPGGITRLRGRALALGERTLLPTYHPAYLLRNPAAKREVWEDLKAILRILGRDVPPPRKRG